MPALTENTPLLSEEAQRTDPEAGSSADPHLEANTGPPHTATQLQKAIKIFQILLLATSIAASIPTAAALILYCFIPQDRWFLSFFEPFAIGVCSPSLLNPFI